MEYFKELVPDNWQNCDTENVYSRVKLSNEVDEYKEMERNFKLTIQSDDKEVLEIYRVENKFAYISAMIVKEKYCFHKENVTDCIKIRKICDQCTDYKIKYINDDRKPCCCYSNDTNMYLLCGEMQNEFLYPKYIIKTSKIPNNTQI